MEIESHRLIIDLLGLPNRATRYEAGRRLRALFPDRAVFESSDAGFDLDEFANDGQCTITGQTRVHAEIDHQWDSDTGTSLERTNGWFHVRWQDTSLQVVKLGWREGYHTEVWVGIVAKSEEMALRFFETVCAYCHALRGQVLVFSHGCWSKSARLFHDIQQTKLDSLILRPGLSDEIRDDLARFLKAQTFYEKYDVPWKRGLLLAGPPGNGKTHCIKGIINHFGLPCLYVRSFNDRFGSPEANVQAVFHRARRSTPCFLIIEDLEAIVTKRIRAYFLNELDGFAANRGLITIGTTNYPERLDPALSERPSRFDVKYTFDLPGEAERRRYLDAWSARMDPEMQPSSATKAVVVERTNDFSFAFLKELTTSSMVEWATASGERSMDDILPRRAERLRPQLNVEPPAPSLIGAGAPDDDDEDEDEE